MTHRPVTTYPGVTTCFSLARSRKLADSFKNTPGTTCHDVTTSRPFSKSFYEMKSEFHFRPD